MRHETWKERAQELTRIEELEYPRDNFNKHPEWRDEQMQLKKKLRELEDENRELKEQKFKLEVQLKRARMTAKPDNLAVTKTDGLFGKSEAEWEQEYRRLAEIRRVRHQDVIGWRNKEHLVRRSIEILEERNNKLRTDIRDLEDELKRLGLEDELNRLSTRSKNLYLIM